MAEVTPGPEPETPTPAVVPNAELEAHDTPSEVTPSAPAGPATNGSTPAEAGDVSEVPVRKRRRPRIPREVRITLMLILLIFVVEYFLLPEIATARKNLHLLETVNPFLLILATGLELCSLLAYAQLTHTVLSPDAPKRFRLFRVNMWSLSVSHMLPGGTAAGTAAGYRMLTDAGVPGSTAAFGMALQGIGSAVVLNVIFWIALVVSIPLNGFNPLYGTAAIVGTLLLAAFFASVLLLTKGQRWAVDRLHRAAERVPLVNADRVSELVQRVAARLELLLRNRRLLTGALVWAAANWLLDAASLWVFLLAFGHVVFPIDLLVAYGLANILAAIPITPGGLGVVELTCAATLKGFGVPFRVASLAVLAWRLVNFWLPIPMGGIAYLSLRFGKSRHHVDRRNAPAATA